MQADTGDQFVGYYTPADKEAKKRKLSDTQDGGESSR